MDGMRQKREEKTKRMRLTKENVSAEPILAGVDTDAIRGVELQGSDYLHAVVGFVVIVASSSKVLSLVVVQIQVVVSADSRYCSAKSLRERPR